MTEKGHDYSFRIISEKAAPSLLETVLESAAEHWKDLPKLCKESTPANVKEAFKVLKSFRVLTAARVGGEGCNKLNQEILKKLQLTSVSSPGSALLITRNCHRTGLSNGDVGIVFAKEPFVICFAGHDTDVYRWEDLIRRSAYDLVQAQEI